MAIYSCSKCGMIFNRKSNWTYHVYKRKTSCVNERMNKNIENFEDPHKSSSHPPPHKSNARKPFECSRCNKVCSRKDNLRRHMLHFCPSRIVRENEGVLREISQELPDDIDIMFELSIDDQSYDDLDCLENSHSSSTSPPPQRGNYASFPQFPPPKNTTAKQSKSDILSNLSSLKTISLSQLNDNDDDTTDEPDSDLTLSNTDTISNADTFQYRIDDDLNCLEPCLKSNDLDSDAYLDSWNDSNRVYADHEDNNNNASQQCLDIDLNCLNSYVPPPKCGVNEREIEEIGKNCASKTASNIPPQFGGVNYCENEAEFMSKISSTNPPQKCGGTKSENGRKKSKKFQCTKCNKTFSRKDNLKRHISKTCMTLNKDDDGDYMCNYCQKQFSRNDSLNRHLNRCVVRKNIDAEKEEIFKQLLKNFEEQKHKMDIIIEENKELREKNNKLVTSVSIKSDCNNTTITNNTQNNTLNNYNIKLVAFGQEDLSYITDEVCEYMFKRGYQSIPQLINYVHFNKNKPEHHNVYIPNMRDVHAMTFDGENWILINRDEAIDTLYDDKHYFLCEKYTELQNIIHEIGKKKFKRFMEDDDDKITKGIKDSIKLLLYNKREIPLLTKKEVNKNIRSIKG